MADTLSNAFLLMAVGMLTVFVILSIVVLAGQFLIRFMNRFSKTQEDKVSKEHLAVISAVTTAVSQGKAKGIKVEKL